MTRLIREKALLKILPISRATLWRWARNGKIPKPNKVSEGVTIWELDSIEAALLQQPTSTSTRKGKTMKVPHTITLKQKFAVGNRLAEVLTERPDGLWEYAPGFDDESIAKEFNIPKHLVGSVRLRAFGKTVLTPARKDNSDLERRVHALEKAFSALDPNWNKIKL